MISSFCPSCGNQRIGQFRYCRSCGFDFDAATPDVLQTTPRPEALQSAQPPPAAAQPTEPGPSQVQAPSTGSSTQIPLLAGIAWLIAAALTGYLAYLQWTYGQAFASSVQSVALWNTAAALVTLFFGARLIASPTRRLLDWSAAWAALSVVSGVAQVGQGDVGSVFVGSVIASAIAGVLSYVGRQQFSNEAPTFAETGHPEWGAAPPGPPARRSRFSGAEVLVIGAIILAVAVGGLIVLGNVRVNQIEAEVASALPAIRPTTRPTTQPGGPPVVALGEAIPLTSTTGTDIGSATVLEVAEPPSILDIPPADGNRYVAAKVRYDAAASWTYNLFDWNLHDEQGRQYEPLGLARNPALSAGTLAPGKNAEGWVAWEVPASGDLWVDLQAADGTIIFSVPVN